MKQKIAHIICVVAGILALTMGVNSASAQTVLTADWTNLGNGNLEEVADGTTLTVGPNSVTIDTNVVTDGDGNDPNFTNFYSTGMLSYYNGQVSSFTGNLLYSTDHSTFDAGDYFETVYTFGSAVDQLEFIVGNVDRFFGSDTAGNPANFHDAVIIEYDTGTGTWQNLRNLAGAVTLGSAVGTATVGGQQGWDGSAYSGGITSTTGDIRVDFGTTTVERVRIRYRFGQDSPATDPSGNFQYIAVSDFSWEQNVPTADLSLTKNVSNNNPAASSALSYTLQLTNSGPLAATGVQVIDILPTGFDFTSSSGTGTYDDATGIWDVGTLNNGQTVTLTINGTVTAPPGVTVTNIAEVFASDIFDADSTPNNGSTTEDDDDSAAFTVQGIRTAGTAPTLVCPAGTNVFDFRDRNEVATTTVNLPNGVAGAQFTIFDVDYALNDFADRLIVTGSYNGNTVMPTLTNGTVNYVVGNVAVGDGGSAGNSDDGNVVVTFDQAIDTIVISYGNANTGPVDPDGQAIAIHDFDLCAPDTQLSVTKLSSVFSDPVNGTTNPKAIPGAFIEYAIQVSNPGISDADADTVFVVDTVPSDSKLCVADISGAGPVTFTDGATSSELAYNYIDLTNTSDDLSFSNDGGTTWNYAPTADADGCDSAITNFRVNPKGAMAGSGSFTLRARFIVE